MSNPVNTNVIALRNPPMLFSDTFSVGGGGSPITPLIRTPVGPVRGQGDGVHPRRHVRVGVSGAGDLVEQLGGYGVDADQTTGARVLGDHRGAVGRHLGQRETGVGQVGDLGEEGEVAAGGLGAALDDVSGDHRAGQCVVIVTAPTEVRGGGPDDHRGVGDPPGDHHVGPGPQTVRDAPAAQVGIRRQRRTQTEFGGARLQVVTLDVGHPGRDAQALRQGAYRVGQPGGIQPAGVGDDAHAALVSQSQAVLELGQEGLGVTAFGAFHPVAAQDQHGQFGQVVPGDVVDVAAGEHLAHRRVPVAVETGAVRDPDGVQSCHAHPPGIGVNTTNQPVG
ncbi:hypothetical protein IWGMT90018_52210 [Mycobacterium kiyosense]|nr:hypothetical protein IWGMT90018_52210 [Mycobacterium kiyosense]